MKSSFLTPGEVETRGSTQYVGKPLPQCTPSASRFDATSEEKKNCDPKIYMRVSSKANYQILFQVLGCKVYLYRWVQKCACAQKKEL